MSDVQPHSQRQAGAEIRITEEMIEAGATVYPGWEDDNIFADYNPAPPFAVRELVKAILTAALAASNTHEPAGSQRDPTSSSQSDRL